MPYGIVVGHGQQHTFEFQFYADPALETRNYHLLIRADFHDQRSGMPYSVTFFNQTVAFHESAASANDWTGCVLSWERLALPWPVFRLWMY